MRVTRTPHLTQRVNRFVQELFAACNEDGRNFILNDEEAYQCEKSLPFTMICTATTKQPLPTAIC